MKQIISLIVVFACAISTAIAQPPPPGRHHGGPPPQPHGPDIGHALGAAAVGAILVGPPPPPPPPGMVYPPLPPSVHYVAPSPRPWVKHVQTQLNKIGYGAGAEDGLYGTTTRAAVKQFQTDNGLTADGSAGPVTRAALTKAAGF